MEYLLQRIDLSRDVHFYTNTTIDTLDYSGSGLNSGSKVVFAAYGQVLRSLSTGVPHCLQNRSWFSNAQICMRGVVCLQAPAFTTYANAEQEFAMLNQQMSAEVDQLREVALMIVCDNSNFISANFNNFLWVAFTRCNPSHDIYGIQSFVTHKHWGCKGPLIIDARIKPHHAPPVEKDAGVEKQIDRLFSKGGSLYGKLK